MWVLALIYDLFLVLISGGDSGGSWGEDLKNRNDRGLLNKPSDKYVC